MSAPAARDLTFVAGDDYAHRITITDADEAPIDVSGSTWRAQLRRLASSATAAASFEIDTTNAATGVIVLNLDAEDTQELSGTYVWSLERTAGGTITTLLEGRVTVARDITRTDD